MTQEVLTDVINWVGVATGVVGAVVVAPKAVVELVRQVFAGARRVLPRRRQNVFALAGVAAVSAMASGAAVVITPFSEDAPIADQIAQLVRSVNQLNADLIRTRRDFKEEDDKLRQEIGQIEQNLRQADEEIRQLMAAAERQEVRLDARGLPLIALSILMTGPANLLAEWAWLAWLLIGLATISVIAAIWPSAARKVHRGRSAPGAASG